MRSISPSTGPASAWHFVPEDTDIFYALWRSAFVVAFAVMPYVGPLTGSVGRLTSGFMEVMLATTGLSCLVLFLAWHRGLALPGYRVVVIANDLLLVTAAIIDLRPSAGQLYEVYGLIIVVATMWFRRRGAFITALFAIVLNGIAQQVSDGNGWMPTVAGTITYNQGAPYLLILAFVVGYLVSLRDREHSAVIQMREELRIARTLQDAMLPAAIPDVPGYEIAVRFQPARVVGGDIYDVRMLAGGELLVSLADLAGHSVYGLVHLSLVHSALRLAEDDGLSPAEIASAVNRRVYDELQPDSYAAVFIGMLDPARHAVDFVNCGHLPPLVLRRGATDLVEELFTGGPVLGAIEQVKYTQRQTALGVGDVIVCYTDGIAEARNRQGEFFGTEGVVRTAQSHATASAEMLAEAILAAAGAFAEDVREDDVTLIVLKRTG